MTSARNQDGFALIEVIVSAAVLAIVALAVLAGIDGATASTARERARALSLPSPSKIRSAMRSFRVRPADEAVAWGPRADRKQRSRRTASPTPSIPRSRSRSTAARPRPAAAPRRSRATTCGSSRPSRRRWSATASRRPSSNRSSRRPSAAPSSSRCSPRRTAGHDVAVTTTAKTGRIYPGTTNLEGCAPFVRRRKRRAQVTITKAGYVDRTGDGPSRCRSRPSPRASSTRSRSATTSRST